MKKFLKFLTIVVIATGFSALNAQSLKVGTNANFPPFEYIDTNSQITGFDIELIDLLSKKIGFEYEVINMGFDGLIPALKSGKIDLIASGMSATEDRKKAVDFTASYYTTENLFIKRADNDKVKTKDNLKGKKVGVQLGTVQEHAAREIKGVQVAPVKDPFTTIIALKNGKIDAVMLDTSVGYGYLRKNTDLVEFLKEPDGSDGFSFAFDKNKHSELVAKINAALKELKADGSYDALLEKYELK